MCIRICCICQKNLGQRKDCDCKQLTHGYCAEHLAEAMKEVEKLEEEAKKRK